MAAQEEDGMGRKRRVSVWFLVVVLLAACAPGATAAPVIKERDDDFYKQLEIFTDALSIVQSDYVEAPKPKDLVYGALKGMLQALDPYSQFMDPDAYNEIKVETEGAFGGLGIEITLKDSLLTIISPIDDTPAFKAGLKSNDRIVKIDGQLTRNITLIEAVKKLRGKPGSSVKLTILREGETQLLEVPLERAIIKIKSVKEPKILEDHIGYVRVSEFHENTAKDLAAAFETLKQQGMDSLVLDLRNNPGGLLDVAVSVAEQFLEPKAMVVSTRGRLRNQNQEFRAHGQHALPEHIPLVVLVNEGSASASEIVAGAVQDHHRGIILGTKSFGKGSVQTVIPLKDGSALRLTTSKYFTPSGRSIHGEGIHPDVVVEFEEPPAADKDAKEKDKDAKEKDKDAKEKDKDVKENGKEKNAPSNPADVFDEIDKQSGAPPVSKEIKALLARDNQLARAVDLLKGIKVYRTVPQ